MTTAPISEQLMTAEEFYQLPPPPEGGKMELVCGKVVTHMPVSGKHGERQGIIWQALRSFALAHNEGRVTVEAGFVLQQDPDLVRAPDVALVASSSLPDGELPEDGFISGPPMLAVEVVSKGDTEKDVLEKVADYLDYGVTRVWAVRAKTRSVVIYYPNGEVKLVPFGGSLSSDDAGFSNEGFDLPLASIFD
ncbi:MAG: Uma2 family endonuclease [Dehalococcoidia bacterium]